MWYLYDFKFVGLHNYTLQVGTFDSQKEGIDFLQQSLGGDRKARFYKDCFDDGVFVRVALGIYEINYYYLTETLITRSLDWAVNHREDTIGRTIKLSENQPYMQKALDEFNNRSLTPPSNTQTVTMDIDRTFENLINNNTLDQFKKRIVSKEKSETTLCICDKLTFEEKKDFRDLSDKVTTLNKRCEALQRSFNQLDGVYTKKEATLQKNHNKQKRYLEHEMNRFKIEQEHEKKNLEEKHKQKILQMKTESIIKQNKESEELNKERCKIKDDLKRFIAERKQEYIDTIKEPLTQELKNKIQVQFIEEYKKAQIKKIEEQFEKYKQAPDNDCKICMCEEVCMVADPCGHTTVCEECANRSMCAEEPKCYICRKKINKYIKMYN